MRKKNQMKPKVLIIMGSESDLPVMEETARVLEDFGIPYEMAMASAHRTPEKAIKIVKEAERRGIDVVIAGAGMAAHLPGVIASHTTLPVIGVPLEASPLKGMDALLSIVQMPAGIPVATVAVGKPGAKNAGILAAQIISRKDPRLAKKVLAHREQMSRDVEEKSKKISRRN